MQETTYRFMRFPGGKSRAFTISYDDGVASDLRLMELMKQYGIRGTFNLNARIMSDEYIDPIEKPTHRLSLAQIAEHYKDFEVATHGATHPFYRDLPTTAAVYDLVRIPRILFGVRYSERGVARLHRIRLPLLGGYRRKREHGGLGILIFFEDLIFCLLAGVSLMILFYECNNGKIRYPAFLIAGAGFLLYRATLGRLVMLLSEWVAFFVGAAVRYLVYFATLPFPSVLPKH